jgi:hypothetical protein
MIKQIRFLYIAEIAIGLLHKTFLDKFLEAKWTLLGLFLHLGLFLLRDLL